MTTKHPTDFKLVVSSTGLSVFPVKDVISEKSGSDDAGLFGEGDEDEGGQALVSPTILLNPTTVVGAHSHVNEEEVLDGTSNHGVSGERRNEENDVEVAAALEDDPIIAELVDHHETNIPHVIAEPAPDEQELEEKRKESERKIKTRLFRRYCMASIVLIAGASVAVGLLVTNEDEAEDQSSMMADGSLGDWDFCTLSSECKNRCCSKAFSTSDGKLKCTPLDEIKPSICVTNESGVLGDWEFCTFSLECQNECCSKAYSTSDDKLKCTPVGGFDPNICVTGGT